MTIEVRQLLIRSTVGEAPPAPAPAPLGTEALERLKQELLAQCRALLIETLARRNER